MNIGALLTPALLARAVITAEDQRFFEHTGYDIVEIALQQPAHRAGRR